MWIDDQIIKECSKKLAIQMWRPQDNFVVLGRSNKAESEAYVDRCQQDSIPILQRFGGGGTVLLHRGCLVISCGAWVQSPYQNDLYFKLLNQSIINVIKIFYPELDLNQRGYSDITIGDMKIAGTSLFRSRNYLLYQASLLINAELDLIDRYLKHPSREPDYRAARGHRSFITGLDDWVMEHYEKTSGSVEIWLRRFHENFETQLLKLLEEHLHEPIEAHREHLFKRAGLLPENSPSS